MTDAPRPRKTPAETAAASASAEQAESERSLGRAVALGLPALTVLGAAGVGVVANVASGLLVLAAGTLLGCIALLWASVRTLSGDAPLGTGFEALSAKRHGLDALGEEKIRLLRALKDLESERAVGKIDEGDYATFVSRVRADAKEVMRRMDVEIAPRRAEAERLAKEYLDRRGLDASAETSDDPAPAPPSTAQTRTTCAACATSNEPDATFCKKCGASMSERAHDAAS